jgi:hypothetical protein
MPKKESEDMTRCHVRLFTTDKEWLDDNFGPTIGYSKAVRSIVRRFVRHMQEKVASKAQPITSSVEDIFG